MREKLLNLMKNEGLTSSRLAEILEIQPSGISHILSGRNKPGFDLLQKILRRFPRINPDWLLLDSDKMYRDEQSADSSEKTATRKSNIANDVAAENGSDLFAQSSAARTAGLKTEHPNAVKSDESAPGVHPDGFIPRPDVAAKNTDRIVIFYSDGTCDSYIPNK